jgi:hypothetical protein
MMSLIAQTVQTIAQLIKLYIIAWRIAAVLIVAYTLGGLVMFYI